MRLSLLDAELAIVRLDPDAGVPQWANRGALVSLTRTIDELSIVCAASQIPEGVAKVGPWRALKIAGPLSLDLTGVLSSIASPLADAGIPLFVISTHDTDYILIRPGDLNRATNRLRDAGHKVEIA